MANGLLHIAFRDGLVDESYIAQRTTWPGLVAGGGTIVVLMGVAAPPVIAAKLLGAAVEPCTPVAVIENGCTTQQRVVNGSILDIAHNAPTAGMESPAAIVIGEVATLAG